MPADVSRRVILAGACGAGVAAALGACSTYGGSAAAKDSAVPGPSAAKPAGPLAKTADIPVGGGKVFADQRTVVTQPVKGTFKAFSATCTHQGCTVADVQGGTINCPCHGSKYKVADGSVANGPATRPLAPKAVTVTGDSITVT